ncbi:hypothetical protein [Methanocorpusculum vombati]|uniref:Uncharacterized protein n=1 Tax=Methanocorpusculum vombati TaxID=3002864 RepID=A0ABT4IQK9_9EURY|nr:hypothetical protein [Methanocorpusculum vombati]MCZ9319866.1 hypothetical protein [Methanocorpusculum sp.]MCZ0863532.1 hypothetical protein [Methanocorpusculum vombati]MDE2521518.1 hypothetical protein [Methanocorpusculum sp.]MDE2547038.1 hypothetical protein [Methanocorpusculum sp.]MDE2548343.1 hypothetical protein [Methanocorpusculum sp.]
MAYAVNLSDENYPSPGTNTCHILSQHPKLLPTKLPKTPTI